MKKTILAVLGLVMVVALATPQVMAHSTHPYGDAVHRADHVIYFRASFDYSGLNDDSQPIEFIGEILSKRKVDHILQRPNT